MFVTALPEDGPRIEGLRQWYAVGDYLEANCTAKMTFPEAQVTWYINNLEVSTRVHFIIVRFKMSAIELEFQIVNFSVRHTKFKRVIA